MSGLDFSVVWQAAPFLWEGLQFSLGLTLAAFLIGMSFGTVLALIQHLEVPLLSQGARGYVALMRSVPLIMVLFWFFFLIPIFLGLLGGHGRPVAISSTATAFITFGLFEAAYYCEIIRTGLRSIPRGQYEACRALALSTFQAYRLVILPQVVRAAGPIILTQSIILFQDTSLVYVLSLTDLLGAASKVAQVNGRLIELTLAVAAIYFVLCTVASQAVAQLSRKLAR